MIGANNMSHLFYGPRLKIERANKHIHELQGVLDAFVNTDFQRLGVEKVGSMYALRLRFLTPFPAEIPAIIGDIVHNLRASLDLAICEAVVLGGGTVTENTRLPFCRTLEKLIAAIRKGAMEGASPAIAELVRSEVRPYEHGGNVPLWGLHALDLADKHRLLTSTYGVAVLTVNATAKLPSGGTLSFNDSTFIVGEDRILEVFSQPEPFELEGQAKPSLGIVFGKGKPFEDESIIPTLQQLSQLVSGILDTFEKVLAPPSLGDQAPASYRRSAHGGGPLSPG
jgi:hypothetical protein